MIASRSINVYYKHGTEARVEPNDLVIPIQFGLYTLKTQMRNTNTYPYGIASRYMREIRTYI